MVHWIVRPTEETLAERLPYARAHLAYRVFDSHLRRGSLSAAVRGGVVALDGLDLCADPDRLALELAAECARLSCRAVLFALSDTPEPALAAQLATMTAFLSARGIFAIVPLSYATECERAVYLVSSAISGGSLRSRLEELARVHGVERLALEHPRICMRFSMPAASADGVRVAPEELRAWMRETGALPFYSPELCTNYCTSNHGGTSEFALFDDARSLSAKLALGKSLGFPFQFLLFSECADFAREL